MKTTNLQNIFIHELNEKIDKKQELTEKINKEQGIITNRNEEIDNIKKVISSLILTNEVGDKNKSIMDISQKVLDIIIKIEDESEKKDLLSILKDIYYDVYYDYFNKKSYTDFTNPFWEFYTKLRYLAGEISEKDMADYNENLKKAKELKETNYKAFLEQYVLTND